MALEAEQGLRINESDQRSAELGQESEASSATLALGQNSQAPQDTVLELQGDTQALQESNSKCEELMKENRQLREQLAKLGIQLRIEKNTSEHLRGVQEELEGELEYMFNIIENQTLPRSPQVAEEKQLEELGEQAKQLTEVQEALLRERETNALVNQKNERLQQEVARLTSWTEHLQAEQWELLTKIEDLQASLENEQENFQIFQNEYYMMRVEQWSKEINLPKLSAQCQSLTLLTKELEEERRQVRSQTNTLKQLSKTLLEEHAGTWPQNKGSLKMVPTGKAAEQEDIFVDTHEAQDPAARIGSLKPMPTGNAEEEDNDNLMTKAKEAKEPAAKMRKRRSQLRAFLRFFQRQRHGSRVQAKSHTESVPGSPEATPAGSGRLEDRDTGSEPLPKATGQQKSAFWSRKKKDKVKDQPPRARSTLSNLLCCCKR